MWGTGVSAEVFLKSSSVYYTSCEGLQGVKFENISLFCRLMIRGLFCDQQYMIVKMVA